MKAELHLACAAFIGIQLIGNRTPRRLNARTPPRLFQGFQHSFNPRAIRRIEFKQFAFVILQPVSFKHGSPPFVDSFLNVIICFASYILPNPRKRVFLKSMSASFLYMDFADNTEKSRFLKWFSVKLSEIRSIRVQKSL